MESSHDTPIIHTFDLDQDFQKLIWIGDMFPTPHEVFWCLLLEKIIPEQS